MFKFCLMLILCLYTQKIEGLSEEMEELAKQLHDDCVGQVGVDEGLIATVQRKEGFPDDEKLKCYIKCIMDEMAIIDDEGIVDVEAAIAVLPDEMRDVVAPTMRSCGIKMGANPCDTVYQTHKCYYDNDKDNYFLV